LSAERAAASHTEEPKKLASVKIRPISVPVTRNGAVAGYVIASFSYIADVEKLKKSQIKPEVYLFELLLTEVTTRKHFDYTSIDSKGLSELARHVKDAVNARLGLPVVNEILAEEIGYVPIEEVRGHGLRTAGGGPGVGASASGKR
jgi:hypothetical protein